MAATDLAAAGGSAAAFADSLRSLAYIMAGVQIVLSAGMLFLWHKYKKAKMPTWAMAVTGVLSLLVLGPVVAIIIFVLNYAYQKFAVKKDDWNAVFCRQALLSGAIGAAFAVLGLLIILTMSPASIAQLYGA